MKLNKELAVKIVENTMSVLGKNINIMDDNGFIIASGDKKRVNTFHEIAREVILKKEAICISEEQADKFKGVKAGINLPIKYNNKIVGVIGITGKSKEVADYGEIVKNMAELILKQEFLLKEIEMENRTIEHFYQQMLSNDIDSKETLKDRADLLNIDLYKKRIVLVIELLDNKQLDINRKIHNINENKDFIYNKCFILRRGKNLVLIKSFDNENINLEKEKFLKFCTNYFKETFQEIKIGVGNIVNGIYNLHFSYENAKRALFIGKRLENQSEKFIYKIQDIGCKYFIPDIKKTKVDQFFSDILNINELRILFNKEMFELVIALINNNLNVTKTAKDLFIHRNTLLYRIKKIKEETNFDLLNAETLFNLYFLLNIYNFYRL